MCGAWLDFICFPITFLCVAHALLWCIDMPRCWSEVVHSFKSTYLYIHIVYLFKYQLYPPTRIYNGRIWSHIFLILIEYMSLYYKIINKIYLFSWILTCRVVIDKYLFVMIGIHRLHRPFMGLLTVHLPLNTLWKSYEITLHSWILKCTLYYRVCT